MNYFTEYVEEQKFMYHEPFTNYNLLVKLLQSMALDFETVAIEYGTITMAVGDGLFHHNGR